MENLILVNVRYTVKPGKREDFLKKVADQGIILHSKEEEGNRKYEYSIPLDSENDLLLTEIWDSAASQALHGETEHYRKLQELKKEYVTAVAIEMYRIAEKR